jgi:hypothetical protein
MSNPAMQPDPSRAGRPAPKPVGKTPSMLGDPANTMNAAIQWSSSGVTISFPSSDFYADDTSQEWTWNGTTMAQAAATRQASFAGANATNSLTVVQTRPSGAVTFEATGIARNTSEVTLNKT